MTPNLDALAATWKEAQRYAGGAKHGSGAHMTALLELSQAPMEDVLRLAKLGLEAEGRTCGMRRHRILAGSYGGIPLCCKAPGEYAYTPCETLGNTCGAFTKREGV